MKLKKILAFCLATVALPVMAADDGVVDPIAPDLNLLM